MIGGIDHEKFIKSLGQILRLAHIVDRLPHRPKRRHGDQIGLHHAAGGILRIFEAALQRDPLEIRKLGEDVLLVGPVEVLQQIDGIVRVELFQRLGDLLGRHFLENLVANRLVELGKRRGLKILTQRLDKLGAPVLPENFEKIGEVRLVQIDGQGARARAIALVERSGHCMEELGTNVPFLIA